jgi:hypothetical protein
MTKLNKAARQALLTMARSVSLKRDFARMRRSRALWLNRRGKDRLDTYLDFLSFANAFSNHAPKPLRKIDGGNFKL